MLLLYTNVTVSHDVYSVHKMANNCHLGCSYREQFLLHRDRLGRTNHKYHFLSSLYCFYLQYASSWWQQVSPGSFIIR